MTTTTLINAQSIGTGSNIGNRLFGAKLTAATTTTAYLISARLTDGAGPTDPGQVRIWYTSASFNISIGEVLASKGLLVSPASKDKSNGTYRDWETDRKSTRLNSSHSAKSRMPSSA